MTKIVTRRENGTQSILVTILRLPSEARVTQHLSTLKTKIVGKMGMRAKLISSPDNLEIVLMLAVFFLLHSTYMKTCIAMKCYLLENVIFIFFFHLFFLSFTSNFSFLFHSLFSSFSLFSLLPLFLYLQWIQRHLFFKDY